MFFITPVLLVCDGLSLRALDSAAMSGHISVALSTDFSIAVCTRWNTLAPVAACQTCPYAYFFP